MSGRTDRSIPVPLLRAELRGQILFIEFSDSSSRNSWSLQASRELTTILDQFFGRASSARSASRRPSAKPSTRARDSNGRSVVGGLVFSAQGRVFCSGGNLKDYAAMKKASEGLAVNREIAKVLKRLSALALPTAIVVEGDCFGGGVELISCFDHIVATPEVFFGLWQRRIGLSFGWGGGARLSARIGAHELKRLAISAENFSADSARAFGLIDDIAPKSLALERAETWIHQSMKHPRAPMTHLKTAIDDRKEARIFESLWWKDEHRAVLAKRKT